MLNNKHVQPVRTITNSDTFGRSLVLHEDMIAYTINKTFTDVRLLILDKTKKSINYSDKSFINGDLYIPDLK